jgi:hypothetical protein
MTMERKGRKKALELSQDNLVEKLGLAAERPKGFRVELGFLGRSDQQGYWRLYLGPELRDFIEVREADIKHSQSLESDSNPLGGTILWLSRGATVKRVTMDRAASQSDFLQGALMRTFLPGTGLGGVAPGGGVAPMFFSSVPCAVVTIGLVIYSAIKCEGEGHTEPDDDDDDDDDGGEGEGEGAGAGAD